MSSRAACSGPMARSSSSRCSSESQFMLRPRASNFSAARLCIGSHGSGVTPSRRYSSGRAFPELAMALTPAAYALSIRRGSGPSRSSSSRATRWSPTRRTNLSMLTPSGPISSLIRPVATRRVTSICQRRSWAWATPIAKAASSIDVAETWGTPQRSRLMVAGAARPLIARRPRTLGRDTPRKRWRATSRARQMTTTRAAAAMRAMII